MKDSPMGFIVLVADRQCIRSRMQSRSYSSVALGMRSGVLLKSPEKMLFITM